MERAGHVYSRISNPTCAVLEERISALEGGVGAIAVASGQAALHLAIATLAGRGLAHRRLARALRRLAQPARFHAAALRHRDHVRRSARSRRMARGDPARTRGCCSARRSAIPGLDVLDIPRVAALAHEHEPAAAGRLDVHDAVSACGRSTTARTSSTTRRPSSCPATAWSSAACWSTAARSTGTASGKFPTLTEPYAGFHDMVFTEESTTARRSCCARGARACAISAPAWRR